MIDNARLRRACEAVLIMAGYCVDDAPAAERDGHLAHDGAEPVDLIIAELSLADGAARPYVGALSRGVPVLYLSRDAYGIANTAAPQRFGAVLTMPFDSTDLLNCVGRLLRDGAEPPPDAPRPAA